jgi:hypothetical protein
MFSAAVTMVTLNQALLSFLGFPWCDKRGDGHCHHLIYLTNFRTLVCTIKPQQAGRISNVGGGRTYYAHGAGLVSLNQLMSAIFKLLQTLITAAFPPFLIPASCHSWPATRVGK